MSNKILKAASFLTTLSIAIAAPTSTPIYPPTSQSQNFRLVANVTGTDLIPSINNYVLTSYHTGAGTAYAVLVSNDTETTGRIFYVNGTAEEVRYHDSDILSDGGTPLFPAGLIINPAVDGGEETVSINAGTGQAGTGLTQFPDPVPELTGTGLDGFYACVNELPSGSAVQLLAKPIGSVTPAGCADVSLLPQCSEGSGLEHPFGNTVNCYADVAGIDWTVYSSD